MYGEYELPTTIEANEISISIVRDNNTFLYKREGFNETVEKKLIGQNGKIILNPIEPLNKPEQITQYLQIELDHDILVEPKSSQIIFLKFPIEIGVFVEAKKGLSNVDIFTFVKQKYTLYGSNREGLICRYFLSSIYADIPKLDPLKEGIMELSINNVTSDWITLRRVVFQATDMKIYYSKDLVSMKASLHITSKSVGETKIKDKALFENMIKSTELYTVRKIPVVSKKMIMLWGF